MKYNLVLLSLFLFSILTITGCKNKKEDLPKSMDDIISYTVLDNYKLSESYYWDEEETILTEKCYDANNHFGRFTASMFSYKKKDAGISGENKVDEKEYIDALTHKKTMIIDDRTFIVGYSGLDDFDDVIGRAYVKEGDYVFMFSMSNFDDFITKEQYNDFINMLKTIKFKGDINER